MRRRGAVPQITVSAETFRSLNQLCGEMLKDFEGVINKLIVDHKKGGHSEASKPGNGLLPDLTGTTLREAEVNGKPLQKVYWNDLMQEVIAQAAAKMGDTDAVKDLITVKKMEGKHEGFYFVPTANLSVQGQNANSAWKQIERIAKAQEITVRAKFMWGAKGPNPGGFETLTIP
jgi:hypothetical protein